MSPPQAFEVHNVRDMKVDYKLQELEQRIEALQGSALSKSEGLDFSNDPPFEAH